MPVATLGTVDLYFDESGEGPPLFLLHGAGGRTDHPGSSWVEARPAFDEHFHTIGVDSRGHGRSNNPGELFDYRSLADDTLRLADHLGIDTFRLAGMSDGAITGLEIAINHADRLTSAVLLGANYVNDEQTQQANAEWAQLWQLPDNESVAKRLSQLHDTGSKEPGSWRALFKGLANNVATMPNYTLEQLASITTPLLLIAGEHDLYANETQRNTMSKTIPNAQLLVIAGAAHDAQHSHVDEVANAAIEFLK